MKTVRLNGQIYHVSDEKDALALKVLCQSEKLLRAASLAYSNVEEPSPHTEALRQRLEHGADITRELFDVMTDVFEEEATGVN